MKKFVVANWKMRPSGQSESREIASRIDHGLLGLDRSQVSVVICPPFVFIPSVRHAIHFASLGAQDLSPQGNEGPFTGQISARQLREYRCEYAIIGHSERRSMGEDDQVVHQKIKCALKEGITPILCVGYGCKKGAVLSTIKKVVRKQVLGGLGELIGSSQRVIVAYEPVWAIGTNKPATPKHAVEMSDYIQKLIKGNSIVIYGGSVTGKNASLFAAAGISGVLVGGASLDPVSFLRIAKSFETGHSYNNE